MVLHPFNIVIDHFLVHTQHPEEVRQELVAPHDVAGQSLAGCGQDEAAVLLVLQQALSIEPLDHVGNTSLGDS